MTRMAKTLTALGWSLVKAAGGKVPKGQASFNFDAQDAGRGLPPEAAATATRRYHEGMKDLHLNWEPASAGRFNAGTKHGLYTISRPEPSNYHRFAVHYTKKEHEAAATYDPSKRKSVGAKFASFDEAKDAAREHHAGRLIQMARKGEHEL